MPTDETTPARLAEKYEGLEDEYLKYRGMARIAFDHVDAERMDRNAAEARLIADALRFRLAALTAGVGAWQCTDCGSGVSGPCPVDAAYCKARPAAPAEGSQHQTEAE